MSLSGEISKTIVDAIVRAPVCGEPFSHLYMKNIFPDDLYSEILSNLPPAGMYKNLMHKEAVKRDGSSTRTGFPLNDYWIEKLDEPKKSFWGSLMAGMQSEAVNNAYFEALSISMIGSGKSNDYSNKKRAAYPKTGLFCDKSGYEIRPHKDSFDKLITTQFYLPLSDNQIDMGTYLYRASRVGEWLNNFKAIGLDSLTNFEFVKRFEFLPNSGYAFLVGPHSWHGRPNIGECRAERHSIMQIYYKNNYVPFFDDKN